VAVRLVGRPASLVGPPSIFPPQTCPSTGNHFRAQIATLIVSIDNQYDLIFWRIRPLPVAPFHAIPTTPLLCGAPTYCSQLPLFVRREVGGAPQIAAVIGGGVIEVGGSLPECASAGNQGHGPYSSMRAAAHLRDPPLNPIIRIRAVNTRIDARRSSHFCILALRA
jgi:hypothetical protein